MQDAYAGDISDLLKFALLRRFAATGLSIGVAWYAVASKDGSRDGRHLEWRSEAKWTSLDAGLVAALAALPERSIAALETLRLLPENAQYYEERVPVCGSRDSWFADLKHKLSGCNLVFLDPDNGVQDKRVGRSRKHASVQECLALLENHQSVAFISFPHFSKKWADQADALFQHFRHVPDAHVFTVTTSVRIKGTPKSRWFTLVTRNEAEGKILEQFAKDLCKIPHCKGSYLTHHSDVLDNRKFLVIYERSEDGSHSAYVPDLPGLGVVSRTRAEAARLIRQGMRLHVEGMIQDGLPLPEPSTTGETVSLGELA